MVTRDDWCGFVKQLIDAENKGGENGRKEADAILAQDFTAITRASGKVEDREALLDAIEKHVNKNHREFHSNRCDVEERGIDAAVVISIVTTHNPEDTEGKTKPLGTYRNVHEFRGGKCISWQVTEQESV